MAKGGYFVGINEEAVKQFEKALEQAGTDLTHSGLLKAHREIADRARVYVRAKAPAGYFGSRDGRGSPPPGIIRTSIRAGATAETSWVSAGRGKQTPHLMLQEFGGGVVWHNAGAGTGFKRTRKRSQTGSFATHHKSGVRSHLIYTKARAPRGYFIWNTAYRLRSFIGTTLAQGIADTAGKHGINVDVAAGGGLQGDMLGQSPPR
jgi:hypothetical protein